MGDKPYWLDDLLGMIQNFDLSNIDYLAELFETALSNPKAIFYQYLTEGKNQLLTLSDAVKYTGLPQYVIQQNKKQIGYFKLGEGNARYSKPGLMLWMLRNSHLPEWLKGSKPIRRTPRERDIGKIALAELRAAKKAIQGMPASRPVNGGNNA